MIFDNVEDQDRLQDAWPKIGCGSILVTCRSGIMADSIADSQLEIPTLAKSEGSALMLKRLGKIRPSEEEKLLAEDFSGILGGLALAIDVMSRHMRARQESLQEFLPYYKYHRRQLHKKPSGNIMNIAYDGDLESLWSISFDRLKEETLETFEILCMFAPDKIPLDLFRPALDASSSSEPQRELFRVEE